MADDLNEEFFDAYAESHVAFCPASALHGTPAKTFVYPGILPPEAEGLPRGFISRCRRWEAAHPNEMLRALNAIKLRRLRHARRAREGSLQRSDCAGVPLCDWPRPWARRSGD